MAPEYYDNLHYHNSWTWLLVDFIFNPKRDLYMRILRTDEGKAPTNKPEVTNLTPADGMAK
jgi:sphingolipid delta-4 desaturase